MSNIETLKQADDFLQKEQAEQAVSILTSFLSSRDNIYVWMKLARAYQILGEELVARAIFRNVILKFPAPHIMNIIAARIPYGKPLVLDAARIIYFNIPKCGSSSLKDAILIANGEKPKQEASHFHASKYEKVLSFDTIDREYADYTSIAILRHPKKRLRSYWTKNVSILKSLVNEAGGRTSYYGLSTEPSYDEILHNFNRYRQIFLDFRHHTDSIVGYVGQKPDRIKHIFDISQTNEALRLISQRTHTEIPIIRNMESSKNNSEPTNFEFEQSVISSFYKKEIDIFNLK